MSIDDLEQRLRSTLDQHAGGQSGPGPDLADVFGRARRIRRRRAVIAVSAAAVAVVAVAVPAGVLVASRDTSAPPPAISTVTSTPSPAPTSSPSSASTPSGSATASSTPSSSTSSSATPSGAGLAGLAIGSPTTLTYLDPAGVVHNGQPLPGGAAAAKQGAVSAFTPYHGGWLVIRDSLTLTQYDGSGAVLSSAKDPSAVLAVSSDGTQTAWQSGRTVHLGIASGMGEGEQAIPLAANESLLGFLGGGVALSHDSDVRIVAGAGTSTTVHTGITPTVVSQAGDLIGGIAGTPARGNQEGEVVDASTGAPLWHNTWHPIAFNDDGTRVAAVPAADNGDPSAIAILDARTGRVIAQTPDLSKQAYLSWSMAWDGDRVVFGALSSTDLRRQALLSLSPDGSLEQVGPTFTRRGNGVSAGFVFMTR